MALSHLMPDSSLSSMSESNEAEEVDEKAVEKITGEEEREKSRKTLSQLHNMQTILAMSVLVTVMASSTLRWFLWATRFFTLYPIILLALPRMLGWILSVSLTKTVLHGFPLEFGSIHLGFWLRHVTSSPRLCIRICVENVKFANPPNFPHQWFLEAGKVEGIASLPVARLPHVMCHGLISPFKATPCPLRSNPNFMKVVKWDWDFIEFNDMQINFELYRKKFNINEFVRILADGEARAAMKKGTPWPNTLQIKMVRGRDLLPMDNNIKLKATTSDPFVKISARSDSVKTKTVLKNLNPMWNEEFEIHITDSSTVLHIQVWDEDYGAFVSNDLMGQWCMTMKYFLMDPAYNHHSEVDGEFEVTEDGWIKGWFPLMDSKWNRKGECGDIQMHLRWTYVEGAPPPKDFKLTALEQLTENSNETQLRLGEGGMAATIKMLSEFPYLYDIKRVTIRNVQFYLADLFRGRTGQAEIAHKESTRRKKKDPNEATEMRADYLQINCIEWLSEFRPKNGNPGITTYKVLKRFFIDGLIPTVIKKNGLLSAALGQIMKAGTIQAAKNFGSAAKASVVAATHGDFSGIKTAMSSVANGIDHEFSSMGKRIAAATHDHTHKQITSHDSEYLSPESRLKGFLEKASQNRDPAVSYITRKLSSDKSRSFRRGSSSGSGHGSRSGSFGESVDSESGESPSARKNIFTGIRSSLMSIKSSVHNPDRFLTFKKHCFILKEKHIYYQEQDSKAAADARKIDLLSIENMIYDKEKGLLVLERVANGREPFSTLLRMPKHEDKPAGPNLMTWYENLVELGVSGEILDAAGLSP